jgi:hypothetical protein
VLPKIAQLLGEGVAFNRDPVAFGGEFGDVCLDPSPPTLLADQLSMGLVALAASLFHCFPHCGELFAEFAYRRPGASEFVAVIESLHKHRRLVRAGLACPIGAAAIGVTPPLSGSSTLAGNRHNDPRDETRRNRSHPGAGV